MRFVSGLARPNFLKGLSNETKIPFAKSTQMLTLWEDDLQQTGTRSLCHDAGYFT